MLAAREREFETALAMCQMGLGAFPLSRVHTAAGDVEVAHRAYEQALRTTDLADERHVHLVEYLDLGAVATASHVRLAALR